MNEFQRKLFDLTESNSYIARFADPSRQIVAIDTYAYVVDYASTTAPVTAASTLSSNLIMDTDSDFVLLYLSGVAFAVGSNSAQFNPTINIQITDKASGRQWFNTPSPMSLVCGAMGFPFLVTSPRVIRPRTTLNVSYTADGTINFSNFSLVMHGARIFYAG